MDTTSDAPEPPDVPHGIRLGEWARRRRDELGLSQADLTERMGIADGNWISRLETGRKKDMVPQPRLGLLVRALQTTEEQALREAGLLTEGRARAAPRADPALTRLAEALRGITVDDATELLPLARELRNLVRRNRAPTDAAEFALAG